MSRLEELQTLNELLLDDMREYRQQAKSFPKNESAQWRLFRSLVNVRHPKPINGDFVTLQDAFLRKEIRNITDWHDLAPREEGIYLWQGDITTLKADAIVNAANSGMTGCSKGETHNATGRIEKKAFLSIMFSVNNCLRKRDALLFLSEEKEVAQNTNRKCRENIQNGMWIWEQAAYFSFTEIADHIEFHGNDAIHNVRCSGKNEDKSSPAVTDRQD